MQVGAFDPMSDPWGWHGGFGPEDDGEPMTVMDLMRAGGMSLEDSYNALYVEDLSTFCEKLHERAPIVARGFAQPGPIVSHGCVDEFLVEQRPEQAVPADLGLVGAGVAEPFVEVDKVDVCPMLVSDLDDFHLDIAEKAVCDGAHLVRVQAMRDGSLRVVGSETPIEQYDKLPTAFVAIEGTWGPAHSGPLTYISGSCRGASLVVDSMCGELGCHEGGVPGEEIMHMCCQNWAQLFGRLGKSRIVPHGNGGGVVVMVFNGEISADLEDAFPPPHERTVGVLWPLGGANGQGNGMTDDPMSMIYGVHSLLAGPPDALVCTEGVAVDNVGLLVKDTNDEMAYMLTRRYRTRGCSNGQTGILKDRGEWRWYIWTGEAPDGVFLVSHSILGEAKGRSVNALMDTSSNDSEACGFTVGVTFLDWLSCDMAPLCYRQALLHVEGHPICWAKRQGNRYLSDLFPSTGRGVKDVCPIPVVTTGGELVLGTRMAMCHLSQQPFAHVAAASPVWSGKFCVLLAKQWALVRRLWAGQFKLPDKLLGSGPVREVARHDMWRWAYMEFVTHGVATQSLYAQWIFAEQQRGNLGWIPPPAVAVLDPGGADSLFWDPAHMLSPGYCTSRKFDVQFMRDVGPRGGKFMPDAWRSRYSALLRYGARSQIAAMVKEWGSVPDPLPTPAGREDRPGFGAVAANWRSGTVDSGWPDYGECYECSIETGDSIEEIVPTESDVECYVDDNRANIEEKRGHQYYGKIGRWGSPLCF